MKKCKIKDMEFVIFLAKNNQLYPVALSKEEHKLLQLVIPSVLDKPITVLDKPQGEIIDARESEAKDYE